MNESQRNGNRGLVGALLACAGVALLAVGMLAGSLFTRPAQAAGPGPLASTPDQTITVSGQGEVKVQPDMAQLNFNIHIPGATADAALSAYNKAEQALLAALQAQGLGDKDVVVNAPAVWPAPQVNTVGPATEPGAPGSAAPQGYFADGTITVTVHDLTKVRDLATAGVKAADGIGLGGVQWGLQDDKSVRTTAMQQAIDNARAQADAVAAKLGLTVKNVAAVTVQPNFGPGPWMAAGKGADASTAASGEASLAQLGSRPDIDITVQVQVSYNFQ